MINDIENNISFKVDVLEAMRLLSSAWNNDVSETTIRNCFRKCRVFKETQSEPVIEELQDEEVIENSDFINFDENIAVCGDISDEEFIQITEENDESAAEEEGSETIAPNILEARASLEVLQNFLESREEIDSSMFVHLQKIEDLLFLETHKGLLQRKVTDYFKKT
ncbi:tigger transposable element-derived protein 6-like [Parasteatoda tepidariorum]|uniref:tigger transposable element-derived protein 6-like n=1 Tax=Parasteatoda tepidariorum TaxID=114398 RepID=UPI0039BD7455